MHNSFVVNIDLAISPIYFWSWLRTALHNYQGILERKIAPQIKLESQRYPWDSPEAREEAFRLMREHRDTTHGAHIFVDDFMEMQHRTYRDVSMDDLFQFRTTPGAIIAARSTLSSMIVSAWTAFETLSADLWERLVNLRASLALVALGASPLLESDSYNDKEDKLKKALKLPIAALLQPGFDIQKMMGTVLKWNKNDWSFQSWHDAMKRYDATFPNSKNCLSVIFDDSTRILAEARNIIVHKGGIVDEKFASAVRSHRKLGACAIGSPISIDGEVAAELVNAASESGVRLIEFATRVLESSSP